MIHSQDARVGNLPDSAFKKLGISIPDANEFYTKVAKALTTLKIEKPRIYMEGYFQDSRDIEGDEGFDPETLPNDITPELRAFFTAFAKGGRIEKTEDESLYEGRAVIEQQIVLRMISYLQLSDDELDKPFTEDEKEAFLQLQQLKLAFEEINQEVDKVIADNITKTLQEGETGILFMGARHNHIFSRLPEDILVEDIDKEVRETTEEFKLSTEGYSSRNIEQGQ